MTHPNLTHWDAVAADEPGVGHPQGRRRDLGTAAASSGAGALLAELPPGGCAAPRRTHADEEELFYILDGEGFSTQDARPSAVGAGDCLLHRVREPTHTLVAGEGGLTYLAFGPSIAREAGGGPPEIGTPQARRPPRRGPAPRGAAPRRRSSPWPTSRPARCTAGASGTRCGASATRWPPRPRACATCGSPPGRTARPTTATAPRRSCSSCSADRARSASARTASTCGAARWSRARPGRASRTPSSPATKGSRC